MSNPDNFKRVTTVSERHTTSYLETGRSNAPAIILVHGWPEISLSWRHQLSTLSGLGFRVVAPDLRGCGGSKMYDCHEAYSQREIVADMVELSDVLGIEKAIWVGHDWGSPVVWNIANHHPERCLGVVSLCVPYWTLERGIDEMSALVNRAQYPESEFPAGQFEYIRFYHEQFAAAAKVFEDNVEATFKILLRRGEPALAGTVYPTALVRQRGGWFGPGTPPPDVPLDQDVLSRRDLDTYVESYKRTGFFGVNSLYMNDDDNRRYSDRSLVEGRLGLPVLFLSGRYDYVSDTERSDLSLPMKARCSDLTIRTIDSGHWMQHEAPEAVNAAICRWIATSVPDAWPR